MIVVVEGPSAAGKTTWCERHAGDHYVPETRAPEPAADESRADAWTAANVARWARVLEVEARTGMAVCDTDPLKLHYTWSLWRIGQLEREELDAEIERHRSRIAGRRLGFADLWLVAVPDVSALRERRERDTSRRRRNFELHVRLLEPLREWYAAIEALLPGSVRWELPPDGLAGVERRQRPHRYAVPVFDALMARLA